MTTLNNTEKPGALIAEKPAHSTRAQSTSITDHLARRAHRTHTYTYAYAYAYTYTHAHTHTHIHIHMHIHTYTYYTCRFLMMCRMADNFL